MNETANVNLSVRDERRGCAEAAAAYGRDTVKLIGLALEKDGDEYLDIVRLQARIAFRFAALDLDDPFSGLAENSHQGVGR